MDDECIRKVCLDYGIKYVMILDSYFMYFDCLVEFVENIEFDFYININGDEFLMMFEYVE